jgi:4-amino-4-deoxy-L-arabinose transferase-like glycosyltransferase
LWLSIRAAESGRFGAFALAGLAAGLAAGTKYNGAVAVLMPFVAVLAAVPVSRWAGALASAAGGAAAGFLAASPYALLDVRGFLDGFADLAGYYTKPVSVVENADLYRKHLQDRFGLPGVLPRAATWPASILVLTGFAVVAAGVRARGTRAAALVLLAFPVAYFWMIANQSLSFGRYAMPLAPAIAIGLGVGTVRLTEWLARRLPAAGVLALPVLLIVLVPPFLQAVSLNRDRATIGTLEQAGAWIARTIRRDEPVVLETRNHTLRLPQLHFRAREVDRLIDHPIAQYRTDGVVYVIAVSWTSEAYFADPARHAEEVAAYAAIDGSTEPVQTFTPAPDHPGPVVRILRIR